MDGDAVFAGFADGVVRAFPFDALIKDVNMFRFGARGEQFDVDVVEFGVGDRFVLGVARGGFDLEFLALLDPSAIEFDAHLAA